MLPIPSILEKTWKNSWIHAALVDCSGGLDWRWRTGEPQYNLRSDALPPAAIQDGSRWRLAYKAASTESSACLKILIANLLTEALAEPLVAPSPSLDKPSLQLLYCPVSSRHPCVPLLALVATLCGGSRLPLPSLLPNVPPAAGERPQARS